jgi:membrane protein YqaA with SNARE-associated domain
MGPLLPPMTSFFRYLGHLAYHAGAPGLILVGFLDSSFLILPFGNDFLLIALTAHHHKMAIVYALCATAGSLLGCWVTIWLGGKGEASIRKRVSGKRLNYIESKVEKHAGWAVAVASIMPPPFPFTTFVAVAAAFDYPRKKLFAVIGFARLVRFAVEGYLAVHYGTHILRFLSSRELKFFVVPFVFVSFAGSAYSIYKWIRGSASAKRQRKPARAAA